MSITRSDVDHVARLARLRLSDQEREDLTKTLNEILAFAGKLQELNTDGVEPMAHAVPLKNVLRPDQVRPSLSQEEALANAPDPVDGFFRVPKIME